MSSEKERKKLATRLNNLFEGIYELTDENGERISETFQRLPLRTGTDYYKVVLNPVSLHGIGRSIKKSQFTDAQDFINQLAQITWNARLYNLKGSKIYNEALILDDYIKTRILPKLQADKSIINSEYLFYPDLGPLPEEERQPMVQDYEEEEEDDEYDDYSSRTPIPTAPMVNMLPHDQQYKTMVKNAAITSRMRENSPSSYPTKHESGIRRGRPPIIDKPFETRIKLILKQMKKLRDPNNSSHPLTTYFERLPDQRVMPNYYQVVVNPISLNEIRAKVRTRKYSTVNDFLADLNLMFQNTKLYYSNDQYSEVLRDCLTFESETNRIIESELKRSEKDLLVSNTSGNDGIIRIPMDALEINGYTYRIGDWVLISNTNDPSKPIVGQIFRLWSTEDGTKYTNVCWYYRPEQTSHKFDRLFYINEVCKTGQYRDHLASEIVGPCYVVFLTRYQKGDPPDGVVPEGCPWFICEFRYNENSHVFNRIRTWKACLPDEIRDKSEQPLIPLSEPRKLIKFESPIKDMLPPNADMAMPIPDPTPGPHANSPPIVGLVYLRPTTEDDELGQYISSPNVTPSPENDDKTRNLRAFLFTPILQMKFGSNISYSGAYNRNSPDYEERSYNSSVNRYRQHMQHQQQQVQQYQQSKLVQNNNYRRGGTPTAQPVMAPLVGVSYHTSTSAYSTLINGGVLAYSLEDKGEDLTSLSKNLNFRKRILDDDEEIVTDVLWYRAPPLLVNNKVARDAKGNLLGHSAQYLSWKLQHEN